MDIFSYMDCSLDLFQDLEGNVLLVTCYLNIDGAINSKVLMWKKKKKKKIKSGHNMMEEVQCLFKREKKIAYKGTAT